MHTLDIAPLCSESPPQKRSGNGTCSQGISQFYLHTHTFIRNRNEPYLPLLSQLQLVLIYRPRRDGRLSRPWCEVAQAEIWTHNLPIANPVLYHTPTSAQIGLGLMLTVIVTEKSKLTNLNTDWKRLVSVNDRTKNKSWKILLYIKLKSSYGLWKKRSSRSKNLYIHAYFFTCL